MNSRSITSTRLLRLIAWGLCVMPVVVAAEHIRPLAHPASSPEIVRVAADNGLLDRGHDRSEWRASHATRLTDEEVEAGWPEARRFFIKHAPNRFGQVEHMTGGPGMPLKRFFVNRWKSVVSLEKQSPELYATRVQEVELEDEVFRLCLQLKRAPPTSSGFNPN